jgi:hypothetical protein
MAGGHALFVMCADLDARIAAPANRGLLGFRPACRHEPGTNRFAARFPDQSERVLSVFFLDKSGWLTGFGTVFISANGRILSWNR